MEWLFSSLTSLPTAHPFSLSALLCVFFAIYSPRYFKHTIISKHLPLFIFLLGKLFPQISESLVPSPPVGSVLKYLLSKGFHDLIFTFNSPHSTIISLLSFRGFLHSAYHHVSYILLITLYHIFYFTYLYVSLSFN